MKHSLPLLALLAANTLSAPLAAQDMSDFLNPGAMASRLGLTGNHAAIAALPRTTVGLPHGYAYGYPGSVVVADGDVVALLSPEIETRAPYTSLVPVPRRSLTRVITGPAPAAITAVEVAPDHPGDMTELLADATRAAPAGANTAIISNGDGAVVYQSEPARPTLWQRLFGL